MIIRSGRGVTSHSVEAMIIGTVAPRALHNLELLAAKYFVVEPQSVGADRALNAIAAHAFHEGDLIVIDFGTATTFDMVDFTGAYEGGIIAPGINLSLDALVAAAAKLPRIAIEAPQTDGSVIGRTIEEQMHIGIYWGYVARMEGQFPVRTAQDYLFAVQQIPCSHCTTFCPVNLRSSHRNSI